MNSSVNRCVSVAASVPRSAQSPPQGAGVSEVTTRWLCKEIERIEEPLKKLNRAGFGGLRRLVVFETDILPGTELATSRHEAADLDVSDLWYRRRNLWSARLAWDVDCPLAVCGCVGATSFYWRAGQQDRNWT
jgi:hypothetical protein